MKSFKAVLTEARNDASKYTDDKLKAVLKQLKDLDQDAPSTKFMLKKIEKEMKKRGLSEQLKEGKLDNFDKAYNTWLKATKKLTATFEAAATKPAAVTSFKLALAKIEKAIDNADMSNR